jgi:dynein heavy chain
MNELAQSLNSFFERQQEIFPRFYLLSNDDLFQILTDPKPLNGMFPFFREMFANIDKVEINSEDCLDTVISRDEETLNLVNKKKIADLDIGKIGCAISESVSSLIKQNTRQLIISCGSLDCIDYIELVKNKANISQTILILDSVIFTSGMELLIREEDDHDDNFIAWMKEYFRTLGDYNKAISSKDLSKTQQMTLGNLINQHLHFRDLIDYVVKEQITDINDFRWKQNIRFYLDSHDIIIKILNTSFDSGNEYLGPSMRIPITPLVDRFWIALSFAIKMKYGAMLNGYTGSGKAEIAKELSKCLSKFFVEYACSPENLPRPIENFIKVTVKIGSWLYIKNIEILNKPTLSTLAQDFKSIHDVMVHASGLFMIGGQKVDSDIIVAQSPSKQLHSVHAPSFAILANAHSNIKQMYLPTEIKQYFRPVTVHAPNMVEIIKSIMHSNGVSYADSERLSNLLTGFFSVLKNLLSSQQGFDFSIRSIRKTILTGCQFNQPTATIDEKIVYGLDRTLLPYLPENDKQTYKVYY